MKILKFETNIWKDENITDPIGNFVNIMPGENGLSWTELFHNRFRELEPGIDSDQILSISFNISFIDDNLDFIKLNHFIIVFMANFKVREIAEIVGWDDSKEQLIFKTIYQL